MKIILLSVRRGNVGHQQRCSAHIVVITKDLWYNQMLI